MVLEVVIGIVSGVFQREDVVDFVPYVLLASQRMIGYDLLLQMGGKDRVHRSRFLLHKPSKVNMETKKSWDEIVCCW